MCGIAGFIDFNKTPDERVLRVMEQSLAHRGPDEGHIWAQNHCALIHRRLRVIDLSPCAAQPMSNEDGRLWVVFNGEIYNFQQLRQTLLELGHQFRSRSDTEVLLHGYEAWGEDLFPRLRGMFAFALWDQSLEKLVLARDRLGKKPLFFAETSSRIVFGSELAIFKYIPDFKPVLSQHAFREYLEYGYVPSPNTVLAGVQRLPAGHCAVWSKSGFAAKPYWSLPIEPDLARRDCHPAEAAADLEILLREAVACRLISDVPLGCFLSGGIDSSLVAALAQESIGGKLKTYTVGFEFSPSSEAQHAAKVARHIGSDHHEIQVNPNSVLAEFENILSKTSEPIADDSFVPTFLISRETRKHVTVALSGDGGDELFAGYVKYRQFDKARTLQRCLPVPWAWLARLPWNDRIKKSLEALATENSLELARWLSSLWKRKQIPGILAPGLPAGSPTDFFRDRWNLRTRYSEVERWMLTDMETYLEGDILPKVDRASMAVGLETRSPFLDHHVMAQALQFAGRADLKSGGKAILKQMLAKRIPKGLFDRPKQGFGMPISQWYCGPLRDMLLEYTKANRLRNRGLLKAGPICLAVQQHLDGKRDFARKLHAVVAFEVWADSFFGQNTTLA